MKKLLMAISVFMVLANAYPAKAQTMISVSMKNSRLEWKWDLGTGGPAEAFRVKCGKASGDYTKITVVTADTRSVPVAQAIDGYGQWYCTVSAINSFDESGNSNEITFNAGDAPTNPFEFGVVSQ